jgi:hypothetical protein
VEQPIINALLVIQVMNLMDQTRVKSVATQDVTLVMVLLNTIAQVALRL